MTVTAAALRELHRIHRQLADLHDRLERGPQQVRAREANVANLENQHTEAHEAATQTRMTVDRKQLDLKSGEQKIVDLKGKLNTCSSNKEYQALLEQIDAAEMANSVLADEILEGFDKIDELEAAVVQAQKNLDTAKQDLEKVKHAVEDTAASIQADLARLQTELASAESALPVEFKADYRRIVRGKGPEGLAVVEEGVCSGCGQQITLNMQNELMLSKAVFCRACGCLLYLPENQ